MVCLFHVDLQRRIVHQRLAELMEVLRLHLKIAIELITVPDNHLNDRPQG